ncbi:MAG: paraquat-inducible protein A [Flavobacteriales bacterium]
MKEKRSLIQLFWLTLLFFFVVNSFLSFRMIQLGEEYKMEMSEYTDILSFKERLLNGKEWLLGSWEANARLEKAQSHIDNALFALEMQNWYSSAFIISALLFLFIGYLAFIKDAKAPRIRAFTLISVAALCLINGIFMPMLEIGAYNLDLQIPIVFEDPFFHKKLDISKEFSGHMYYYYQNKSVVDLIGMLFAQKNFVVGVAILSFSIMLPVLKLSLSLLMLANRNIRHNTGIKWFVSKIGKWSMADVFVAAAFLSYLSFNNMNSGIETEAHSLPGLYYFLAYCILSIASSLFIEKAIHLEETAYRIEE